MVDVIGLSGSSHYIFLFLNMKLNFCQQPHVHSNYSHSAVTGQIVVCSNDLALLQDGC